MMKLMYWNDSCNYWVISLWFNARLQINVDVNVNYFVVHCNKTLWRNISHINVNHDCIQQVGNYIHDKHLEWSWHMKP